MLLSLLFKREAASSISLGNASFKLPRALNLIAPWISDARSLPLSSLGLNSVRACESMSISATAKVRLPPFAVPKLDNLLSRAQPSAEKKCDCRSARRPHVMYPVAIIINGLNRRHRKTYYLRRMGEINCNHVANQHHVYAHKLRSLTHGRMPYPSVNYSQHGAICMYNYSITVPRVELLGYMWRGLKFTFYDPAGSA